MIRMMNPYINHFSKRFSESEAHIARLAEQVRSATAIGNNHGSSTSPNGMRPLGSNFTGPGPYDVICARGKNALNHAGNIRFRQMVVDTLDEYGRANTKAEKSNIVSNIVDAVRGKSPHGGFVKEVDGEWFEVGDHIAREKCGQSFRDLLHTKYKSSTKAKMRKRKKTPQQSPEDKAPSPAARPRRSPSSSPNTLESFAKSTKKGNDPNRRDKQSNPSPAPDSHRRPANVTAPTASSPPYTQKIFSDRYMDQSMMLAVRPQQPNSLPQQQQQQPQQRPAHFLPPDAPMPVSQWSHQQSWSFPTISAAMKPPPLEERISASIFDLPDASADTPKPTSQQHDAYQRELQRGQQQQQHSYGSSFAPATATTPVGYPATSFDGGHHFASVASDSKQPQQQQQDKKPGGSKNGGHDNEEPLGPDIFDL